MNTRFYMYKNIILYEESSSIKPAMVKELAEINKIKAEDITMHISKK